MDPMTKTVVSKHRDQHRQEHHQQSPNNSPEASHPSSTSKDNSYYRACPTNRRTRRYSTTTSNGTSASVKCGYAGSSSRRADPDLRKFERVVKNVNGSAEGSKDGGDGIDDRSSSDHGVQADDRTPMDRFLGSTSWMDKFFQEQREYVAVP